VGEYIRCLKHENSLENSFTQYRLQDLESHNQSSPGADSTVVVDQEVPSELQDQRGMEDRHRCNNRSAGKENRLYNDLIWVLMLLVV
jgi:hypothetical protein